MTRLALLLSNIVGGRGSRVQCLEASIELLYGLAAVEGNLPLVLLHGRHSPGHTSYATSRARLVRLRDRMRPSRL